MADIAGSLDKMNDIEVTEDAPHSEALMVKISANINALIDLLANGFAEYDTAGTYSLDIPEGIYKIGYQGVGGGGGGGSGEIRNSIGSYGSGGGGGGSLPKAGFISVTPGETLTIVVGAKGTGGAATTGTPGHNGTAGAPSYIKRGSTVLVTFWGGSAGLGASGGNGGTYSDASFTYTVFTHGLVSGGKGGDSAGSGVVGYDTERGGGGTASKGGGGGAAMAAGGNGGAVNSAGTNGSRGSGGGGGGGNTSGTSGAGGDGGAGYVCITI